MEEVGRCVNNSAELRGVFFISQCSTGYQVWNPLAIDCRLCVLDYADETYLNCSLTSWVRSAAEESEGAEWRLRSHELFCPHLDVHTFKLIQTFSFMFGCGDVNLQYYSSLCQFLGSPCSQQQPPHTNFLHRITNSPLWNQNMLPLAF